MFLENKSKKPEDPLLIEVGMAPKFIFPEFPFLFSFLSLPNSSFPRAPD
jgi:hypothetical protein